MSRVHLSLAGSAALVAAIVPATALSQDVTDTERFARGEEIYSQNCSQCHQADGSGNPPAFPALKDNENLADPGHVTTQIREGGNGMPPFPNLSDSDVAAVGTYVRNAWGNDFGPMEAAAQAGGDTGMASGDTAERTIWDGVFTRAQAEGAERLYRGACAACHGDDLDGAAEDADMGSGPPLAGRRFLRDWDGQSLASLYEYTRSSMPQRNPGQFSDQRYLNIIAYMLLESGAEPGDTKLTPANADDLTSVTITRAPAE